MKVAPALCCLLTVAVFAFATATEFDHDKGWFVPTENNQSVWYSKERYEAESAEVARQPRAAAPVKFYLYTRSNPSSPQLINIHDANALHNSRFNKENPTRFIIHGWQGEYTGGVNQVLRDAFFAAGDYNVFCVDWSVQAAGHYVPARYTVSSAGAAVAAFVDFLNLKGGMSFGKLDVIGFSLGAHVAGYTGKLVQRGKVHAIYGLDPAMPLFNFGDCATRLCSTDASFVKSIQTNGGQAGFLEPIGKYAFYPNGGKTQPGCGDNAGCSHERSFIYLAEAIRTNNFPTIKCSSFENAINKNCGSTYSSVRMGQTNYMGSGGVFYVPVKSTAPYGMGA